MKCIYGFCNKNITHDELRVCREHEIFLNKTILKNRNFNVCSEDNCINILPYKYITKCDICANKNKIDDLRNNIENMDAKDRAKELSKRRTKNIRDKKKGIDVDERCIYNNCNNYVVFTEFNCCSRHKSFYVKQKLKVEGAKICNYKTCIREPYLHYARCKKCLGIKDD